ncbi:hypothetical protein D3C72_2423160 [compost metagenome]
MKADTGEGDGDLFFEVQVTQFHGCGHAAEGQGGNEAVVDLTQLQLASDVTVKTQLAASG